MYAYFDVDERTTLRLQRLIRDKKIEWSTETGLPVLLVSLMRKVPARGTINFADNAWTRHRHLEITARSRIPISPFLPVCSSASASDRRTVPALARRRTGTEHRSGKKFVYVVGQE